MTFTKRKLIAIVLLVLVALGAFFGIGAAIGHSTPTGNTQSITQWVNGPGYADMMTVKGDLNQVSSDADADDVSAVTADGSQLAADATKAEALPPPENSGLYMSAMGDLVQAGDDLQNGDYTDASPLLTTAGDDFDTLASDIANGDG